MALTNILTWIIPPLEKRTPHTTLTVPLAFVWLLLTIGAAHLRLRHAWFTRPWRIAYCFVAIPLVWRTAFAHYFASYKQHDDGSFFSLLLIDYSLGAYCSWGCAAILEFCLESDESKFDVQGSEEYRSWIAKEGSVALSNELDEQNLKRPAKFPGWNLPLSIDLVFTARGAGYGRGGKQAESQYKAGYSALIDAEKLSRRPASEARALKWKTILRVGIHLVKIRLLLDLLETINHHPAIIPTPDRHYPPISVYSAREGVFGILGPYIVAISFAFGFVVVPMHAQWVVLYLLSLLFTKPSDVPITISRFEPPLFLGPHKSTSLRDLWGKYWHKFYRLGLVFVGYRPMHALACKARLPRKVAVALGVLGTFLASGLIHEMCLEAVLPHFQQWNDASSSSRDPTQPSIRPPERGFGAYNFTTTRFFLAQGFGMLLEDFWTSSLEPRLAALLLSSGKRSRLIDGKLRSALGWMWCVGWVTFFGIGWIETSVLHGFDAASPGGPKIFRRPIDWLLSIVTEHAY